MILILMKFNTAYRIGNIGTFICQRPIKLICLNVLLNIMFILRSFINYNDSVILLSISVDSMIEKGKETVQIILI